jgi:methyl-accepting chemotaxis protein
MSLTTTLLNPETAELPVPKRNAGSSARRASSGSGAATNDSGNAELQAQLAAIRRSQAVIEFDLDGKVLWANENFLSVMGYSLQDIQGRHHSMFVEPSYANSSEYRAFWRDLADGRSQTAEWKRLARGGKEIWIQATYSPVLNAEGRPYKVVKIATDITQRKMAEAEVAGKQEALNRAQAIIDFTLDGTILQANDNFLTTMGYSLEDIKGRHHSMFVDSEERSSHEYKQFWRDLAAGEFKANEYLRYGRGGKQVWIQGTYNPIFDVNGKPFKVVKFATDITDRKLAQQKAEEFQSMIRNAAINVMYADTDLVIRYANDASINTLRTLEQFLPCKADEIVGKNIDIFHKNPSHQRRFLADPSNLPHRAYIKVGPELLNLMITAVRDNNGKYVGAMVTWDIATKVEELLKVVEAASHGDLTREINVSGNDPVGKIGDGLSAFLKQLRGNLGAIGNTAALLASSSEELSSVSHQIGITAEETTKQTQLVSAASTEVDQNVQTVAAGAEEMSASIKEISRSATNAMKVAHQAVELSASTSQTMSRLEESSSEIGKIIKVITSIAQQTNLLALNATIEAARAGEAGKGFAVVATEVKELARQTARATEDIGRKVDSIQGETQAAVKAINQVSDIINQINDISNSIASAVEEQTASTAEISRNVASAAQSTTEISGNIARVASSAEQNSEGATQTKQAASELARMAAELQQLVSQFRC